MNFSTRVEKFSKEGSTAASPAEKTGEAEAPPVAMIYPEQNQAAAFFWVNSDTTTKVRKLSGMEMIPGCPRGCQASAAVMP